MSSSLSHRYDLWFFVSFLNRHIVFFWCKFEIFRRLNARHHSLKVKSSPTCMRIYYTHVSWACLLKYFAFNVCCIIYAYFYLPVPLWEWSKERKFSSKVKTLMCRRACVFVNNYFEAFRDVNFFSKSLLFDTLCIVHVSEIDCKIYRLF